jgi:hypothetical protein
VTENSPPRLDLFGDPVPANWGMRGRPEHVPSEQNRRKVSMLLALGWSNARIAAALFITVPTLRKHYFSELRYRAVARDRLDAAVAMKLWAGVEEGNVGAIREFRKLLERNDLMLPPQIRTSQPADADQKAKLAKIGKKEAERQAAREPDTGTPLGELMAKRQGQQLN